MTRRTRSCVRIFSPPLFISRQYPPTASVGAVSYLDQLPLRIHRPRAISISRPLTRLALSLAAHLKLHALRSKQEGVRALCHRRAGPTKTSDASYIWGGS